MTLSDWLDGQRGRMTALAKAFGVTPSAITQWRMTGVPVNRMLAVRSITEGAVSLEEMVRDRSREAA